ncbi:MAG: type III-B CRISPR-associated protein Cas10/Cmr2 [Hyphomicrobiales bacterium]|nr:type III-B CRISPR-associated protein Cas10/Cmr2 [Hyphomicrobiales bacterium]
MTTPPAKLLHFTLGPVQGFIADARRVRDLWAGSFLLSWLSGQGMVALVEAGKKTGRKADDIIIFPSVSHDRLFTAIQELRNGDQPEYSPYVGSLPNRFKADVTDISGNPAQICEQAIADSWGRLADSVWDHFLEKEVAVLGKGKKIAVRAIWDRQVGNFWDINWVTGDDPQDGSDAQWLDKRKNWRSHFPLDDQGKAQVEEGDLCRLMGCYQELSGHPRIGGKESQQKFWDLLREQEYLHVPSGKKRRLSNLNIGDDERLCAIALIKRLFPLIAKDVIGWQPGGENLNIINWPSVSYIASVPWLKVIDKQGIDGAVLSEAADGQKLKSYKGETETRLFGLPPASLYDLDGHLFHEDGVRLWVKENLKSKTDDQRNAALDALLSALKGIRKETGKPASEFYAILQMDGDQIGKLLRDFPNTVKDGLALFTAMVTEYFDPVNSEKNPGNGVLIYAGGDDVLALLPLDSAIEAAVALQQKYGEAFKKAVPGNLDKKGANPVNFTMSASIIFAQYKIPLSAVLKKSHSCLDKIAKEENGRNSLAIAVMKPGGIAFDWVSCWNTKEDVPISALNEIAKDRSDFSSSFFYNIRERYAPLFADQRMRKDHAGQDRVASAEFADPKFMESVLAAEYKKQPGNSKLSFEDAKKATAPLRAIGQPLRRAEIPLGEWEINKADQYNFDGALVARFMSMEGCWHLPLNTRTDSEND